MTLTIFELPVISFDCDDCELIFPKVGGGSKGGSNEVHEMVTGGEFAHYYIHTHGTKRQ